jgi:Peptidase A4 family
MPLWCGRNGPCLQLGFRMPLPRYLVVPGAGAVMAGALTLSGATATVTTATATVATTATAAATTAITAAPSRASHAAPRSARFLAEARSALVRYLSHGHPQAMLVHPDRARRPVAGTQPTISFNWSGYADVATTAGTFTKVSGSWTTPGVTCSAEDQVTSNWVGLDGFSSSTVEQLGTVSWCYKGSPVFFTWYEMFPADTVEVGTTLRAGDKIAASVTRSGQSYTLKLTDSTHPANSFTHAATCKTSVCLDTSAEWIAERPSFSTGIAPQAHYNAFKITNGAETANGKSGTIGSFATNNVITMIDATQAYNLNTVSRLNAAGNSFSTTFRNSY